MPSHNSMTSLRNQLYIGSCYSLYSVSVRRNDTKSKHEEESHEVKEKLARNSDLHWGEEPFLLETLKDFFLLRSLFRSACPDYSGTSPLEHLYSRDTSIQGTQKLVPKKCPHNLCICYLYLGERDTFVGPKAQV